MKNSKWPGQVCLALLLALLSVPALAQTSDWAGTVSTDFFNLNNWNPALASATAAQSTTMTIRAGTPNNAVLVGGSINSAFKPGKLNTEDGATFTVNGILYPWGTDKLNGTITINAPADLNIRSGSGTTAYIGRDGNAIVTINGGALGTRNGLVIGSGIAGSSAKVTVAGGAINVGGNGAFMDLSMATSTGTTAELNITGGAVNITSNLYIGSRGKIFISEPGFLKIGGDKTAQLNGLVASGQLSTPAGKTLQIAFDGTHTTASIRADVSDWVGGVSTSYFEGGNWNPQVSLSNVATTTLTIHPGNPHNPVLTGGNANTGYRPAKLNMIAGAQFTVNGILVPSGSDFINGTLTVNAQADLNIRSNVYIGSSANAVVNVNGGALSTRLGLYIGTGTGGSATVNVAGGAVNVASSSLVADMHLASTAGTSAQLNITGGTVNLSRNLVIGSGGKIFISGPGALKIAGDKRTQLNGLVASGQLTCPAGKTLDFFFDGITTTASIYVNPNSLLRETATEVVLSNGMITAVINKATSNITSLKYNGVEQLNQLGASRKGTYYDFQTSYGFETMNNCVFSIKVDNDEMVDVSFKRAYNPATGQPTPADADIHYVLHKGDKGLYSYSILEHKPEYPDFDLGSWRMVQWIAQNGTDYLCERIYVDSLRNWEMPSVYDFQNASATPIAEIVKLNTGVRAGKYDGKYEYSAPFWEVPVYGHASDKNNIGTWIIMNNPEFMNGGPTHQDLNAAAGINHVLLNGLHYGDKAFVIPQGEQWSKMYGPFLMYTSAEGTGDENWADAKRRAEEEKAKWPYEWLTNTPEYPLAHERGSISGKFIINDPAKPAVTGANAWVGVTQISNAHNEWQHEGKNYHYWARTNADGSFTVPNVRPGTYTFYAYTDGEVGEYKMENVTVTAGGDNNLGEVTWNIARDNGKFVFQVGVPNRTTSEMKLGDFDYCEGFVEQKFRATFPATIEYNTQENNWSEVLPYAHTKYPTEANTPGDIWKWRLHFTLPANLPQTGNAKLTIAYASNHNAQQWIYVNNESRTFTTYFPENGDGNAFIRQANYAKYSLKEIMIPMDRLVAGNNTITLVMPSNSGFVSHLMYDYISLEASIPDLTVAATGTNVSCNGGTDGKITVAFNGGLPAYEVKIGADGTYAPQTAPFIIENLPAGEYTVFVRDAGGEEVTATVIVEQPADVTLALQKEDVRCFNSIDGSIMASFAGGTAPYQLKFGTDGTYAAQASTFTFDHLGAGSYTVFVKDANGCEKAAAITIGEPAALQLGLGKLDVQRSGHADGSITATFSYGTAPYQVRLNEEGAFTAQASPYTFSNLYAGDYTVYVMDANGCEIAENVSINQNGVLDPHAGTKVLVYPNPSSRAFTLQVNGKFKYQIHDATFSRILEQGEGLNEVQVGEQLAPGLYYLRVQGQGKPFTHKLLKN